MGAPLIRRSAGIVPVRRLEDGIRFLLLRCYRYWDFPKGELDPGEEPLEAARRELAEETGLAEPDFPWGEEYVETAPYGRGKIARYYLAECRKGNVTLPVSPELGAPEHHEYRWADAREAESLLNDRVRRVLRWALSRIRDDR